MANYSKIEGIIAVIDDSIKDAAMQCDWACEAKDAGERETAMMFHGEASKRLTGAKEWLEKNREMLHDPKNAEAVAKIMVRRLEDKITHMMSKTAGFKA